MSAILRPFSAALIAVLMACAAVPASSQQSDAMSDDRILGFASYLEGLGEYRRAATELERLLARGLSNTDSLTLRIGSLYIRADAHGLAERAAREQLTQPGLSLRPQLQYLLSHALYRQQRFDEASEQLSVLIAEVRSSDTSTVNYKAPLLAALCKAEQRRWDDARADLSLAEIAARSGEQKAAVAGLKVVIDESAALPQKSPFIAGLLSGILPGAGKVYTGHTLDGVLSFLTIAGFGYAAYDGFASDGSSSVRGWIFGSLAGGLYLGNIYGSALSASIVRDEATRQLQLRLRTGFAIAGAP
ncbi:MAG: hypothetical protein FGM33_09575 [Candidatus Kapabacteria bacterium]|nr:hypothetical protein [Candidatus Kapabacteria bacterium]